MSGLRYSHDTETHNQRAALQVVPYLLERFAPNSVIDVGCALGSWLAVFAAEGCEILGLEGEDVADELLEIPRQRVRVVDLEEDLEIPGHFDLALALEVAEHLTEAGGRRLVSLLTSVADIIVFSAAVPGQGGDNHLNEQWPEYWQRLFAEHGFVLEDEIRWQFWQNEEVAWWYGQNMFIVRREEVDSHLDQVTPVIHPRLLEKKTRTIDDLYQGRIPLRSGVLIFLRSLMNAIRFRTRP